MKPAADEFEEIAKRLKELEAEKVVAPLPLDDLPSDVEPIALKKAYTIDEYWAKVRELQAERNALDDAAKNTELLERLEARKNDVLTVMPNGEIKRHDGSTVMSIYGDPFWDALVRNGVIKIGVA